VTAMVGEPEIRRELADASSLVHAARDSLARGEAVALAGLEERVASSCRALAGLPRARARSFEAPLIALIDELEKLSRSLSERHQTLKSEMESLGRRRRAATAYANGGRSKNGPANRAGGR
jgi:hypothetical protein